jgi:mRNA interferase YafQ
MRRIEYGAAFRKDHKRMRKRGAAMPKLDGVVDLLMTDQPLAARNRPHRLSGEWKGFWECHIEPDWLLIYDLDDPQVVALHRTGTHSDLFE